MCVYMTIILSCKEKWKKQWNNEVKQHNNSNIINNLGS